MKEIKEIKEFLRHIQPKVGEYAFLEIWQTTKKLEKKMKKVKKMNYIPCCTQLLCVDKGDDNGITRGYEYKCIKQNKTHYKIIDNYSQKNWFEKEYFEILN